MQLPNALSDISQEFDILRLVSQLYQPIKTSKTVRSKHEQMFRLRFQLGDSIEDGKWINAQSPPTLNANTYNKPFEVFQCKETSIPVLEWLISNENVRSLKLFARWSTGNHDLLVLDTIDKRYFGSFLKSFCLRVRSDARLARGYGNQIDQLSGRGRRTLGVPPADFPRFFLSAFSFSSSSIISRSINVISVLQRRWSSYNQQQRWQPLWIKIIRMLVW